MTQQEIRQFLENDRELWEKIDRSVGELCRSGAKRAELLQLAEQDDALRRLFQHVYELTDETLAKHLHHLCSLACDGISERLYDLGLCHEMLAYADRDFENKTAEALRAEIREDLIAHNLTWAEEPITPHRKIPDIGWSEGAHLASLRVCEQYRRTLPDGAVKKDLAVCMVPACRLLKDRDAGND